MSIVIIPMTFLLLVLLCERALRFNSKCNRRSDYYDKNAAATIPSDTVHVRCGGKWWWWLWWWVMFLHIHTHTAPDGSTHTLCKHKIPNIFTLDTVPIFFRAHRRPNENWIETFSKPLNFIKIQTFTLRVGDDTAHTN